MSYPIPYPQVYQIVMVQMANNVSITEVTVKRYYTELGIYNDLVKDACLEHFIQLEYAKYTSDKKTSFHLTDYGIKKWWEWFNSKEPKPYF